MTPILASSAVLLVGVGVSSILARQARMLAIPALLLLGVAAGPTGMGALRPGVFLEASTEVGLVLLLFFTSLVGNPRALREGGRVAVPLAAYDLLLNFAVAWWIGAYAGFAIQERLLLGGILASSSTGVILKILGDEGRIGRREGNVLVSLLFFEDWFFLGLYGFLALRLGATQSLDPWAIAAGLAGLAVFLLGLRTARTWVWRIESREALVALLSAVALAAAYLGTLAGLPAVGCAFTAGLVLSDARGARLVEREAPWVRDAASAIFFVGYGALLGPIFRLDMLPLLGLCVAGILVSEILFLPLIARRLGLLPRESFTVGACLVARGGKSAAFARLSHESAPGTALYGLGGLLALVLTPLAPLMVRWSLRRARKGAFRPSGPVDEFSRTARGFLIPHDFRQRTAGDVWDSLFLASLTLTAALLGVIAFLVPGLYRLVPAMLALACLPSVFRRIRARVRRGPGSPWATHPLRRPARPSAAFDHLPTLLVGPLALLVVLGVFAPWSLYAYPAALACLLLVLVVSPFAVARSPRAPPLARALRG